VFTTTSIYEGRLFVCFVVLRSTKLGASDHVLDVAGKLLMRRGAWAWFHGLNWACKSSLILNDFFTEN